MTNIDRLISFVHQIRKYIFILIFFLVSGTVVFYFYSGYFFSLIQSHLHQELVFYTVAEPFLAHVKIALSLNFFVIMPVITMIVWHSLATPFKLSVFSQIIFIVFTCVLFYCGSLFCYFITLPYGINFLLSFQSEQLQPIISVDKFVTFVTVFVLAFGLIFELPIVMVFLAKTGLVARKSFENGRRYAILVISITAALLTPTPDIVNMMLMGVPLYMLYELGIIILKISRI